MRRHATPSLSGRGTENWYINLSSTVSSVKHSIFPITGLVDSCSIRFSAENQTARTSCQGQEYTRQIFEIIIRNTRPGLSHLRLEKATVHHLSTIPGFYFIFYIWTPDMSAILVLLQVDRCEATQGWSQHCTTDLPQMRKRALILVYIWFTAQKNDNDFPVDLVQSPSNTKGQERQCLTKVSVCIHTCNMLL
ncbi:uncharacterized protein si:dkey-166k12.1 [Electrophorus electricus]|uniref:uncharacterized protein si:dkey-166k12.1 n=1 Tax=Electrophorus electricus TaxID=8005 RepID=UPI0015CFFB62|nr:uncharacterized protein si:dkey-166k12.1 [Electrophorus electricus]